MSEDPVVENGYFVFQQTVSFAGAKCFASEEKAVAEAKALLQSGRGVPVVILQASRVRFAGQTV